MTNDLREVVQETRDLVREVHQRQQDILLPVREQVEAHEDRITRVETRADTALYILGGLATVAFLLLAAVQAARALGWGT